MKTFAVNFTQKFLSRFIVTTGLILVHLKSFEAILQLIPVCIVPDLCFREFIECQPQVSPNFYNFQN